MHIHVRCFYVELILVWLCWNIHCLTHLSNQVQQRTRNTMKRAHSVRLMNEWKMDSRLRYFIHKLLQHMIKVFALLFNLYKLYSIQTHRSWWKWTRIHAAYDALSKVLHALSHSTSESLFHLIIYACSAAMYCIVHTDKRNRLPLLCGISKWLEFNRKSMTSAVYEITDTVINTGVISGVGWVSRCN